MRRLYLAAYDVSHPRRLRAMMVAARRYATGGQKSVYECFLSEPEKAELLATGAQILDEEQDRLLLLRLDPRSKVRVLGLGVEPVDPPFFYQS